MNLVASSALACKLGSVPIQQPPHKGPAPAPAVSGFLQPSDSSCLPGRCSCACRDARAVSLADAASGAGISAAIAAGDAVQLTLPLSASDSVGTASLSEGTDRTAVQSAKADDAGTAGLSEGTDYTALQSGGAGATSDTGGTSPLLSTIMAVISIQQSCVPSECESVGLWQC